MFDYMRRITSLVHRYIQWLHELPMGYTVLGQGKLAYVVVLV